MTLVIVELLFGGYMLEDLNIDHNSHIRTAAQMLEHFRSRILSGQFKPGDRLPTTTAIIKRTGVGTHTVCDVMDSLKEAGLIEAIRGRGKFVVDQSRQGKQQLAGKMVKVVMPMPEESSGIRHGAMEGATEVLNKIDVEVAAGFMREYTRESYDWHMQPDDEKYMGLIIWFYPKADLNKLIQRLRTLKVPVVFIDGHPMNLETPFVVTDNLLADSFLIRPKFRHEILYQ